MGIPKFSKHEVWKKHQKGNINLKCKRIFPECPEIPSLEKKECKLCPYNEGLVKKDVEKL